MQITSDVILKGPIWAELLERLKGKYFDSFWDVYSLCISIGIIYDKQIDDAKMIPEGYSEEPKSIPRTLLVHSKNDALLEYMLKTSILTTRNLELNEEERLKLSFDDENNKEYPFKPLIYLTKFANYGAVKLHEVIKDIEYDLEEMDAIATFLEGLYIAGTDLFPDDDILEEYE